MKFKKVIRYSLILVIILIAAISYLLTGSSEKFFDFVEPERTPSVTQESTQAVPDITGIPPYSNTPYVEINQNVPQFTEEELNQGTFENYAPLDALGRVGTATALIGTDLMPTQKRGSISEVKPSGWVQADYDFVDGGKLYNRCHLIAYQLTAEGKNENNLMTGTRYFNTEGMLPFENQVADYIRETNNHVLYRVTPIFEGNNLLAKGVQIEAMSVEDRGAGVSFNVFCYNVEPGVIIDYATGESTKDPNFQT